MLYFICPSCVDPQLGLFHVSTIITNTKMILQKKLTDSIFVSLGYIPSFHKILTQNEYIGLQLSI